ncbi:MAG: M48 family metalloprotease [Alphaproteobacteria bacterium]|nr:M48 family metalloprotease [Alphaproteobacteria bacterium]
MVAKVARLISCIILCFTVLTGLFCKPVNAESMTLISDAETQNFLAEIIRPLYRAAGVNFDARKIFIVNDNSLNAFVSDGNYMFVHTGTLIEAQNTNELSGILAHETGHIMGGHIVRQKLKLQKMQYVMLGSMIAAGAAAISTGRGDAAMAVMLGSQSSAINSILHYQTQEERSADESAIKLLSQTKQSTQGLQNFMNKIRKRNALSGIAESPYFRTHPMTSERISHFAEASKNNHFSTQHPLDEKFALIKAKLSAFLLDRQKVARMYPDSNDSLASRYAQSILAFRQNDITTALRLADGLIAKQPNNPYFHELKGQFLFESGRVKESVAEYETALKLLPNNYLLQLSLAQSLLENNPSSAEVKRIINLLQKSLITEQTPIAWQLLSRAYDMNNQRAASLYAAAEFSYGMDNLEIAQKQLENARKAGADKSLSLKISDLEQRIKEDLKERGF